MRKLVAQPGAGEELLPLLDEQLCRNWLAYQLIELTEPSEEVRGRCLAIIREIASADDGSGIGAEMWLKQQGIAP